MNPGFHEALLDPALPVPEGLTTWNRSDPARRFSVYRNNVVVSLVDALADTFTVTRALVGEAFFRAMAQVFVQQSPPRSRVIAFYGEGFPGFIETFLPAASVPYLADVARLEMLRVQAYHAADVDSMPAGRIARLIQRAEVLPGLRIEFQPATGLLQSNYAVVTLWAAHQQDAVDLGAINTGVAESALVIRPQLDVEVVPIAAAAREFVVHLMQGSTLGQAFANVCADFTDFDLTAALGLLLETGAIAAMNASRCAEK